MDTGGLVHVDDGVKAECLVAGLSTGIVAPVQWRVELWVEGGTAH